LETDCREERVCEFMVEVVFEREWGETKVLSCLVLWRAGG
jgi:hypothetical protein